MTEDNTVKKRKISFSRVVAVVELIAMIVGSIALPIYLQDRNEKAIIRTLGNYLGDIDEDASFEEMLQQIAKDLKTSEDKNQELETKNVELEEKLAAYAKEVAVYKNVDQIISQAKTLAETEKYKEAISALNGIEDKSPDIEFILNEYTANYETQSITEAERLKKEQKYDEAVDLIDEALTVIPESSVLKEKKDELESGKPTKFSDLNISNKKFYEVSANRETDTVGNKYSSNVGIIYAEGEEGYGSATYYLGGKYKYLSMTIAVSGDSEESNDYKLEGRVEIYIKNGTEYTLVYESPTLDRTMAPIAIEQLDINNAESIEVRYYNNEEYYSFGFHSLKVLIADGEVYN